MKVNNNGKTAAFISIESDLFHTLETDKISLALMSAIRHITATMLSSERPIVVNIDEAVARVPVVESVLVVVIIEVNISLLHHPNRISTILFESISRFL